VVLVIATAAVDPACGDEGGGGCSEGDGDGGGGGSDRDGCGGQVWEGGDRGGHKAVAGDHSTAACTLPPQQCLRPRPALLPPRTRTCHHDVPGSRQCLAGPAASPPRVLPALPLLQPVDKDIVLGMVLPSYLTGCNLK
jgi:hypothetical protein